MRFNDRELRHYVKSVTAQLEGTLTYRDSKDGSKERKLRLVNSLLLMYRVSPNGVFTDLEPTELLILTNCTVKEDTLRPNSFQIVSPGIPFYSTYTFTCKSSSEHAQWMSALTTSSIRGLLSELERVRHQLEEKKKALTQQKQSKSAALSVAAAFNPPPPTCNEDMLLIDFS